MRALLDINVLIALLDPQHIHHSRAHGWFAGARISGWASCPLTENGCVRVLANPAYSRTARFPAALVVDLLRASPPGRNTSSGLTTYHFSIARFSTPPASTAISS